MTPFKVGDVVWVDEGDGYGCVEYRGKIVEVMASGELKIKVTSTPIGPGAAKDSIRYADPALVFEVESARRN